MSRVRLARAEARKVSKIYGRHRALHAVSLELVAGKVTALLGPNGSGKSTLLSLFSTLSRPSSGSMHFGEFSPEESKRARGAIGLLSHAALTYGELTARENVTFYGKLAGVPDASAKAAKLLSEFGLEEAMDRPARTFSRGMLQRLGLARALVSEPSLVLLDEPFTGLDRASTERVVQKVAELRAAGALVLLISHDLAITAELADETAILVRGKLAHLEQTRMNANQIRDLYSSIAERRGSEPTAGASA